MAPTLCVLCGKRLKLHQRRPVNPHLIKYLRKNFMLETTRSDFICGKCSRPAYPSQHDQRPVVSVQVPVTAERSQTEQLPSPPTVSLSLKTISKSHSKCFFCKKAGSKLVVVPSKLRTDTLVKYNVLITADSRCCPAHLNDRRDCFQPSVIDNIKTLDSVLLNRTTILSVINKIRQCVLDSSSKRLSFDNMDSFSNEDLSNLTGLNKEQFLELSTITEKHVRNTPVRSHITTLGIFLFKLKSGLSNKVLSTLFDVSKSSIRRAVHTVRKILISELVPKYLGFQHISRVEIIKNHTRSLSQSLLAENSSQAIIVLDGTYIYIKKSSNFKFQRRSYSIHKGRPLVKPMVIVSTTGYFISVLGPYLADSKNSDSGILNHAVKNNIEEIKTWAQPNDIFVVDRGFRDSLQMLEEMGIKAQMPRFMPKGAKQLSTMDANHSRLVTKVRWVVEASNARIKRWKFLDHVLPTNQIPFIGDYVRIVCAISNKFLSPLNATKDLMDDTLTAERMRHKTQSVNQLQAFVQENELHKRSISKWQAVQEVDNFPAVDDFTLSLLTLGTYQIKLCPSYAQEYLDGDCDILVFRETQDLLRVRLQSRHVSSKSYLVWIQYDSDHVKAWYCQCRAGARTVGTCSHVAAVIWYLGTSRQHSDSYGVQDWSQYLDDAAEMPQSIDSSDSDSDDSTTEE